MTYYKVKSEYDNKMIGSRHFLVGNELYTEKEAHRLNIPAKCVDKVNVRKCDTYFCFGARFCLFN